MRPDFLIQQGFKACIIQPSQVRANGNAFLSMAGHDGIGCFHAPVLIQSAHQPFRHRIGNRASLHRILYRVRPCQFFLAAHQIPQNTVAHSSQAIQADFPAKVHSRVGGGTFRNPVFQQNLTGAQPQHIPQLDIRIRPSHDLIQCPVQLQLLFQGIVSQARG